MTRKVKGKKVQNVQDGKFEDIHQDQENSEQTENEVQEGKGKKVLKAVGKFLGYACIGAVTVFGVWGAVAAVSSKKKSKKSGDGDDESNEDSCDETESYDYEGEGSDE